MRRTKHLIIMAATALLALGCSTKNNTSKSRFWHSFTARYNTYYNGSQAFIDGSLEKEKGNKDNYTELLPLYPVGNKQSREIGKGQFDRAIEKMEKAIKQHSIKAKPDANFMMKIGLKMAQKKMAKAVAKKPLLKYTVSNGVITVVGGGKKGKGDVVYTIKDGGNSLRCNDGEKTYTLKRKK